MYEVTLKVLTHDNPTRQAIRKVIVDASTPEEAKEIMSGWFTTAICYRKFMDVTIADIEPIMQHSSVYLLPTEDETTAEFRTYSIIDRRGRKILVTIPED